jgi:hypothetical protein
MTPQAGHDRRSTILRYAKRVGVTEATAGAVSRVVLAEIASAGAIYFGIAATPAGMQRPSVAMRRLRSELCLKPFRHVAHEYNRKLWISRKL